MRHSWVNMDCDLLKPSHRRWNCSEAGWALWVVSTLKNQQWRKVIHPTSKIPTFQLKKETCSTLTSLYHIPLTCTFNFSSAATYNASRFMSTLAENVHPFHWRLLDCLGLLIWAFEVFLKGVWVFLEITVDVLVSNAFKHKLLRISEFPNHTLWFSSQLQIPFNPSTENINNKLKVKLERKKASIERFEILCHQVIQEKYSFFLNILHLWILAYFSSGNQFIFSLELFRAVQCPKREIIWALELWCVVSSVDGECWGAQYHNVLQLWGLTQMKHIFYDAVCFSYCLFYYCFWNFCSLYQSKHEKT